MCFKPSTKILSICGHHGPSQSLRNIHSAWKYIWKWSSSAVSTHRSAKCYMTAENRSTRHGHHLSRKALANCSYGAAIDWQEEIKLPHRDCWLQHFHSNKKKDWVLSSKRALCKMIPNLAHNPQTVKAIWVTGFKRMTALWFAARFCFQCFDFQASQMTLAYIISSLSSTVSKQLQVAVSNAEPQLLKSLPAEKPLPI